MYAGRVCSAHAEVIPPQIKAEFSMIRLLRTRGGNPSRYKHLTADLASAPHTRR